MTNAQVENENFSKDSPEKDHKKNLAYEKETQQILCKHCLRTKDNGIRCIGACVADNDY